MMHGKDADGVLAHIKSRLSKEFLDGLTMAQEMRLLGILRRAEAREDERRVHRRVGRSDQGVEEESEEVGKRLEAALRVVGEREEAAVREGDED